MKFFGNLALSLIFFLILGSHHSIYSWEDSLNKAVTKLKEAKSFRYDFSQTSWVTNMDETLHSEGFMFYEAASTKEAFPKIYLEYSKPEKEKQILVFDGKILWTYRPSIKQVNKQSLSREDMEQNSMLFIPQWLESLLAKAQVKDQGINDEKENKFLVTPLQVEEAMFEQVELIIDQQQDLKSYILVDRNNNRLEVKIKSVQYNLKIEPQKFIFSPPADTEIIENYPMDRTDK